MSTELFPKQTDHSITLLRSLLKRGAALDASDTGTGKTICACHIASYWQHSKERPVAVVCPKAVVTMWQRALAAHDVRPLFVMNYEKLRTARHGFVSVRRQGKSYRLFKWEVPSNTLLIFDEVQACKGNSTQNAQLLIAARNAGLTVLCLSATAAQDPTEMRALGYALGLFPLAGWTKWMKGNGCGLNPWGAWKHRQGHDLSGLRRDLYNGLQCASKLRTCDLPGAFRENHIEIDLIDVKGAAEAYDEGGVTTELVDKLVSDIDGKTLTDSTSVLTQILRARQKVEALKVPVFAGLTRDLVAEGRAVVPFFNFRESIALFRELVPECGGVVIGGQSAAERQAAVDAFQANTNPVLAVTVQAGGTGLSLHDTHGDLPRVTLVSPTFSVQQYLQVLGRAHRAGGKSDTLQKVLVAAGTIEEYVMELCEVKRQSLTSMLG